MWPAKSIDEACVALKFKETYFLFESWIFTLCYPWPKKIIESLVFGKIGPYLAK
jgi:hypothetical protein